MVMNVVGASGSLNLPEVLCVKGAEIGTMEGWVQ